MQSLLEVLLELEESYHVKIHTDLVELNDMKITTSYSEQSIDAILETIGTSIRIEGQQQGGWLLSDQLKKHMGNIKRGHMSGRLRLAFLSFYDHLLSFLSPGLSGYTS